MSRAVSIVVAFYIGFAVVLLALDGPYWAERDLKNFLEYLIQRI